MSALDKILHAMSEPNSWGHYTPETARALVAEHDADRHAEVLADLARLFDDRDRALPDGGSMTAADVAALIRQHAAEQPGKASPTGPTATQPATNEAAFTAVASPMEYGYLISVRRDPHPEGHVPVAMERLHTDTGWDPAAADALLLAYDKYTTAPGSYWQPMDEGRYGIRLRREIGGDDV